MRRAIATAAVLVLAGCGGGGSGRMSKRAFEQHLKHDGLLASRAAVNASTAAGQTSAQYTARLALAQRDMHRAAQDLDGVDPPADAQQDTDTIVRGLRFFDTQLAKLHHAAATGDSAEATAVSAAVGRSSKLHALDAAIKDLQRKGYDVGVFGG